MALDTSQFYKDPTTGTNYTSYATYLQNTSGQALPSTIDPNTGQTALPGTTAIPADTLGTATPIKLAQPSTDTSTANAAVAGAETGIKSAQDYYNEQNSINSPISNASNSLTETLLNLLPQEQGKAAYTAQQENAAGVNDISQSIRKLSSEITTDIASYNKQYQSQDLASGETPISIVRGRQAALQRTMAADIQLKNARLLALQGDLGAAKDTAQRAVDLKYAPIEEEIQVKQAQLQVLAPLLEADQKKQANALQMKYQDDQQRLADKKAQEKAIQDIALQAASYGATPEALTAIGKATNPMEAITIAGRYLSAPFRLQQQQVAISAENAAIARKNANKPNTAIVEQNGQKYVVTYDDSGNITNTQPIAPGSDGANELQLAKVQDNVSTISSLLNDRALNSSVGPIALARGGVSLFGMKILPTTINTFTGAQQNFIGAVEQLRTGLNLQALINAKSQGATFGALSDQELKVLANSATKLGSWAVTNKAGQVTGYNIDENSFRTELNKINNYAKLDYILKGGNAEDVGVKIENDGSLTTINWDGTVSQLLK